jgi:hypothetical protein
VSVFSDGLSYPPRWLSVQADGSIYAAHYDYRDSTTGQTTPGGLFVITNKGVARRVLQVSLLNGIALAGGQLNLVDQNGNLRTLVPQLLDTSQLAAFRTTVTGVVNYVLSRYNGSPDIFQLITLGEARKIITDPTLLDQVNQAISKLDSTMRSRQKTDGGWWWSNSGQPSDALATALVGLGLEYQSPPADDPALLNAVQFLINTQATDGSWYSADNVMSTRFAATSLVMAFLPRVLDKLGGLNVDLHVTLPSNVTLSNASLPPSGNVPSGDGGNAYTWSLPGVTTQGRTIEFDLKLANLQSNETRAVAEAAYLLSTNSFDSSQVRVDLPIPQVHASDGLSLISVQTDSATYPANSTVNLTAQATNVAPVAQSGTVVFTIKAADGSIVATLPPVPFTGLAPNAVIPLTAAWPAGTTLAGSYTVVADLYDGTGAPADEKTTAFAIVATSSDGNSGGGGGNGPLVTLRVTTDKPVYSTTDRATIGDLVQNITVNAAVASATLQLQVLSPTSEVVYTQTIPLGQLVPGALRQLSNLYAFSAAAQGTYNVQGTVVDGSGQVLAAGSARYQVQEDAALTITGTESVQLPTVNQGDVETCTDGVANRGTQSVSNLPLQQLVVNLDTGTPEQQGTLNASLAAGANQSYVRVFSTGSLAVGHHACVIQAQIDGSYKPLANAVFEVKQPPVKVEGSLSLGSHGRLLVLLDGTTPSCNDPHNHSETLTAVEQQAWLESFLTQEGWSYTITTSAADFTAKLRTGDYSTYLYLAEYTPLQTQVEEELREHINNGEGLYMTGWPDPNHSVLDAVVGVQDSGQQQCPTGVQMLTNNVFGLTGQTSFTQGQNVQLFSLKGASVDGAVMSSCATKQTSLVTHNVYGNGLAALSGFDLLAEASVASSGSLLADLMRKPLAYVSPAQNPPLAGRVVPVHLTVTNDGIANTTQVSIASSTGSYLVASSVGTVANGQLTTTLTLAQGQNQGIDVWVQLPPAGSATVTATLTASAGNATASPVMVTATFNPVSKPALDQAISDLTAYVNQQGKKCSQGAKQALNLMQQADKQLDQGNVQTALSQLVQATDQLIQDPSPALKPIRLEVDEAIYQVEKLQ